MKVRCLFLLLLAALSASAETYKIDPGTHKSLLPFINSSALCAAISIDLAARSKWTANIRRVHP